jgi:2-amino-4-hydroxy-6-hydroxymethyldihydropteridine diphosphokinase
MRHEDALFLEELKVRCIIGIFPRERKRKQTVLLSLKLPCDARKAARSDDVRDAVDYKRISKRLLDFVGASRFRLVESLAEAVAALLLEEFRLAWAAVSVSKPGAVRHSRDVGVRVIRYAKTGEPVYVSIGSNVGKERMVEAALAALRERFGRARFSSVYESPAVGGPPQPPFWNAVAEIRTPLSPAALRQVLKAVETKLGRKRTRNKYAPRPIDLDIVFYGSRVESGLKIPHPDAAKAPYILLPLAELNPGFVHPVLNKTVLELLGAQLTSKGRFRKVS